MLNAPRKPHKKLQSCALALFRLAERCFTQNKWWCFGKSCSSHQPRPYHPLRCALLSSGCCVWIYTSTIHPGVPCPILGCCVWIRSSTIHIQGVLPSSGCCEFTPSPSTQVCLPSSGCCVWIYTFTIHTQVYPAELWMLCVNSQLHHPPRGALPALDAVCAFTVSQNLLQTPNGTWLQRTKISAFMGAQGCVCHTASLQGPHHMNSLLQLCSGSDTCPYSCSSVKGELGIYKLSSPWTLYVHRGCSHGSAQGELFHFVSHSCVRHWAQFGSWCINHPSLLAWSWCRAELPLQPSTSQPATLPSHVWLQDCSSLTQLGLQEESDFNCQACRNSRDAFEAPHSGLFQDCSEAHSCTTVAACCTFKPLLLWLIWWGSPWFSINITPRKAGPSTFAEWDLKRTWTEGNLIYRGKWNRNVYFILNILYSCNFSDHLLMLILF